MNRPAYTIRTAKPADRPGVVELIHLLNCYEAPLTRDRRIERSAAEEYYRALMGRIANQQGRLILAEADRTLIATLALVVQDDHLFVRDDVRRHGLVTDLFVREEWRGRGVGSAMLAEAERLTRAAGLSRLSITVVEGNGNAERLYRTFGFGSYSQSLVKDLE